MAHRYSKAICERDHAGEVPQHVLDSLPENQGHPVRHRCAACAYAAGLNEATEDVKQLIYQVKQLTEENERLRGVRTSGLHEDQTGGDELADAYPDSEFKNLTRSTVALLGYWREPEIRLRFLADQLRAPDLVDAVITPEFPTPSANGKASFTDLLLESATTAVAIEGKRNERRYPTVAKWCDSENKRRVLNHWRSHIRRRAALPDDTTVDSLIYQMIHRTASACARPAERAIVLYQVFDAKHVAEYEADLRALAAAIQPSPQLEIWLHLISTEPTDAHVEIERQLESLTAFGRPSALRDALKRLDLFRFTDTRLTRIA